MIFNDDSTAKRIVITSVRYVTFSLSEEGRGLSSVYISLKIDLI